MRLFHLQDAHLKPQTWASVPAVKGDAYQALDQVLLKISYIHEGPGKPVLIVSGDLFDSTRVYASDLEAVQKMCSRCHVYYILGTHDYTSPPFLSSMPNTTWLQNGAIEVLEDGTRLSGIQYTRSREQLLQSLELLRKRGFGATCDSRDILVLHQGVQHLLGFEGAFQLTLQDLLEYVPNALVLCGHVHKQDYSPFETLPMGLDAKGAFLSTGPLYPQEMPQTKAFCGFDEIEWNQGESLEVTHHPIKVRNYGTIDSTDPKLKGLIKFAEQMAIKNQLLPPLVNITIAPGTTLQSLGIRDEDYPGAILRPVVVNTQEQVLGTEEPTVESFTLEDAVKEEIRDPDDQTLMLELLHSENPETALRNLLKEQKVETR